MKKKETKSVATPKAATTTSSSPLSLTPVGGADALPSVGAPTPPTNDDPVPKNTRKGKRVFAGELDVAENAARELRASTLFSQVLGAKLGTAQQIANAIDFAAQWDAANKAGATWNSYTQVQSNLAWNYALAMIDRLRVAFQAAAATDPAIEKELPNFTKLLSVRQTVAAKGVATKRKIKSGELVVNKPGKTPTASTAASTPAIAPAPAQASSPAPAEATPAPVAPAVTPVTTGANGVAH